MSWLEGALPLILASISVAHVHNNRCTLWVATNYDPVAQNRSEVIVPLLPCGNYYFSVATEYYNADADAARITEPTFRPDLIALIYVLSWHDSHSP
jgi:hypothetical protein